MSSVMMYPIPNPLLPKQIFQFNMLQEAKSNIQRYTACSTVEIVKSTRSVSHNKSTAKLHHIQRKDRIELFPINLHKYTRKIRAKWQFRRVILLMLTQTPYCCRRHLDRSNKVPISSMRIWWDFSPPIALF